MRDQEGSASTNVFNSEELSNLSDMCSEKAGRTPREKKEVITEFARNYNIEPASAARELRDFRRKKRKIPLL